MKTARLLWIALFSAIVWTAASTGLANSDGLSQGRLDAFNAEGKSLGSCPLKHTDVKVDVAGFIARVTVRQQFHNPFEHKIEAVYAFPLSQNAAVDRMTMTIGDRVIEGEIKERGEARQIYESAKAAGKVASLLDQERPNIFTQSVANIEPGEKVDITISYSETLDWEDGLFHFDFPMVVGPRYIPGGGTAPAPMTTGRPTPQVPDADRITPPVTPEGTRAGHDISVAVHLDAGLPIRYLESKEHEVTVRYNDDKSGAEVKLKDQTTIPNKDFVLVYQTASDKIEDTVLAHTDERGKFFTLVLQPPKRVRPKLVVPKELVFVIDKSGSMRGFPIETAKEAMALCIDGLHENDTFNLMTFEGGVGFCFPAPVPNTPENHARAQRYLASLEGSGGTEMMTAIHACLAGQDDPERLRVVCFMTDGYVGNDMAIVDAVRQNAGTARVFSFGIGKSVNRFLLDGIARAGRGEVHYILNQQQTTGAAEKFYERVRMPVLTDIELDFGDLEIEEVYPIGIPDLFSSTPVVVKGRYKQGRRGTITLKGTTGEGPFEREIQVNLPGEEPKDDVLASLWARAKVEHLMDRDLAGVQRGNPDPAVKEEILGLGMRYRLLTQFTSFVAVEHVRITEGGQPRTVAVPVEMPEGVSYDGVFGGRMFGSSRGRGTSSYYAGGARFQSLSRRALARPSALVPAAQGLAEDSEAAGQEEGRLSPAQLAERKLAAELRGLAEKVAKQGVDGNLTIGKIEVHKGRVEVRVQLSALSDEVLAELTKLGFKELGRAKSVNLLIGTIDVKKLEALALLDVVRRVDPAG
ncbi:MAG: VIT and vWA domain-containing protein [Planctomycetota bacterium]|jgi:Ca-activated chloride channel family protein